MLDSGAFSFIFQSTLPARGATPCLIFADAFRLISIHAPREGSDPQRTRSCHPRPYFNPRSPRGERLDFVDELISPRQFQSTLPARGATQAVQNKHGKPEISIHAPREGSDRESAADI